MTAGEGVSKQLRDRRREGRYPISGEAVRIETNAYDHPIAGILFDLSHSGARLRVLRMLSPGQDVSFDIGNRKVFGRVANCGPTTGGFEIGVQILQVEGEKPNVSATQ